MILGERRSLRLLALALIAVGLLGTVLVLSGVVAVPAGSGTAAFPGAVALGVGLLHCLRPGRPR